MWEMGPDPVRHPGISGILLLKYVLGHNKSIPGILHSMLQVMERRACAYNLPFVYSIMLHYSSRILTPADDSMSLQDSDVHGCHTSVMAATRIKTKSTKALCITWSFIAFSIFSTILTLQMIA